MSEEVEKPVEVALVAPIPVKLNEDAKVATEMDFSADMEDEEMYGDIRVLNMGKAKSLLKKELFEWLEQSDLLKRMGITTVQVAFTKCGRFALMVARSKLGQFGLRLAVLDPHHRLSTYLLGVSMTLESALLHSAARVKQIEDDVDEIERTFKHGDVIHVEHLGYSHVAVYDAERQVFYELIGDIDSGKDALLAQVNSAQDAALQFHEDIKNATSTQLKSALSLFRSTTNSSLCPFRPTSTEATVTQAVTKVTDPSGTPTASTPIHTTVETIHTPTTDLTSVQSHEVVSSSASTTPDSASYSESSLSSSNSFPPTPKMLVSTTATQNWSRPNLNSALLSPNHQGNHTMTTHTSTTRVPSSLSSSTSSVSPLQSDASTGKHFHRSRSQSHLLPPNHHSVELESSGLEGDALIASRRERDSQMRQEDQERQRKRASLLAHSGHVFDHPEQETRFYGEEEAYQPILSNDSVPSAEGSAKYDAKSHLQSATRNLRRLATSWDDFGLNALLKEDESNYVTAAERDESIQPDDMCPAIAIGFASHSIAEVQATPKDIFLTRDPLLKKTVKFYANALPADVVVARARMAVGSPGWNPVTRNCEHFATWAKTGRTVSTQVYEFGANAAILGASTLQLIVTLAFIGLVTVWFVGRFAAGNSLVESIEACLAWGLKYGVVISSVVFCVGLLIHWQNGTAADFDAWVLQRYASASGPTLPSSPPTPAPSPDSDTTNQTSSRPSTPPQSVSNSHPSPPMKATPPTSAVYGISDAALPAASLRNSVPRERQVKDQ